MTSCILCACRRTAFFQQPDKGFARLGEKLIFFPGNETGKGDGRLQGNKGQIRCMELEELVDADGTGNACPDKLGRIGNEVEPSDNLQVFRCHLSPGLGTDIKGGCCRP